MDSATNFVEMPAKTKAPRHSDQEWELQKRHIEQLYIVEDRSLKEVIQVLEQEYDFIASEKQIKSRLPKWGLDTKNLKGDMMVELARTKAKREAVESKKSSFRVNKKSVDDRKIERFLQRKDISEEHLLTMASPVEVPSPGFSVFTPQTVRSSVSPSPSLNFQSLSLTEQVPSGQFDLLPTIEEEVTDNDGVQVNTENDASSVSTWASTLVTDNQIFSDEIYQHRTLYVAWQNAVTRQHVPYAELMDHRRHPIGYRDQNVYIWSCDSCGRHKEMPTLIDHCPGCMHLRCSMCLVETVWVPAKR